MSGEEKVKDPNEWALYGWIITIMSIAIISIIVSIIAMSKKAQGG